MTTFYSVIMFGLLLAVFIGLAMPFYGKHTDFDLPIDCKVGQDCFIQNYVDLNADEGEWQDYTCGPLSYDGHKGTDFRLKNLVHMEQGVNVLASANGKVRAIRDGMPDDYYYNLPPELLADKECGNGVVIVHEKGYETQYCHLKEGSVKVKEGQRVSAGDVLGQVGMSGQTEFPHLHFSLRKEDAVIDPFSGPMETTRCGDVATSLWSESAQKSVAYKSTGLLSYGFTSRVPKDVDVRAGKHSRTLIRPEDDAIIFWADAFGVREGDMMVMQLFSPEGEQLVNYDQTFESNLAQAFNFIGKKRKDQPWPEGIYTAHYIIERPEFQERPIRLVEHMARIEVISEENESQREEAQAD